MKHQGKPELLAPLNNWKSLSDQMHVLQNADAVYFGLEGKFSMRSQADNFLPTEIEDLVNRVHAAEKKCYITTNILVYNMELIELHQILELAKKSGVDAAICHDLAAIMMCKQLAMPFHISTQANISNKISAKVYESLGASRLILARELDLDDIKEIIDSINIPVETFIHGAMCTAVSGRCYFSSELSGNNSEHSANRGACLQPCRRIYNLIGLDGEEIEYEPKSGMFFSAKDLCMIEHIPELITAGIASFKIEGRMRDPLYIGEVTSCYREAIDSFFDNTYSQEKVNHWLERLSKVFNRGFHTGFYFHPPSLDDIQRDSRGNQSKWHKIYLGRVIHFYPKVNAVEVLLHNGQIHKGDELIFENKSDFYYKQKIESLEINKLQIDSTPTACAGQPVKVGIKVDQLIPENAIVSLYTDNSINDTSKENNLELNQKGK